MAGATIGRYRIVEKIGEGGMGVVYEAEQEMPRRRVALKMVRGGRLADDVSVRLFQREAEMLGRLEHPGIAAIYEAGRAEDGQYFLAMELVRGRTFDAYLRDRPAAVSSKEEMRHRLRVFLDICDAVHYAHQRGVIHRDLKPSNIVVAESEGAAISIKVLDFGLARIADPTMAADAHFTRTGTIQGTLAYMSPEQVRGDPRTIDTRTDVYSLGVVLYQMISGAFPYDVSGSSLLDAARTITDVLPKPVTSVAGVSSVDADLATIVAKALEKEADRRYSSAAALRDDVERYLGNQPILARPPSTTYQLRKLIERNRAPFVAGLGVLGLLIAFGVVMSLLYRSSEANLARALEAEKKAATEAETAKQVSGFLTNLFEVSNPEKARGNQITARELLDQGAQRIRTDLSGRPTVQARLMRTMGNVYLGLGLYDEARALLVQSVEQSGPNERAESLSDLSVVESRQGKNEEALRNLELALATHEAALEAEARPILRDRIRLAGVLNELGKYPESRALFERTLPEIESKLGPESDELIAARDLYANLLSDLGDRKGALALYEKSLAVLEKTLPSDHPRLADVLQNIATMYVQSGELEKGKAARLRSLAIQDKVFGAGHPATIGNRENLAILYSESKEFDRALEILEENVQIWERTLGPDHPNIAQTLMNLGLTYHRAGSPEKARPILERALDLRRRKLGEEHLGTVLAMYNLANVYTDLRLFEKARPLYLSVIAIDRKLIGEVNEDFIADLEVYAVFLRKTGETREAEKVESKMVTLREKLAAAEGKTPASGQ